MEIKLIGGLNLLATVAGEMRASAAIAETCTEGQLVALNPNKQIIQTRDFLLIDVNARQLTAPRRTLLLNQHQRYTVNRRQTVA